MDKTYFLELENKRFENDIILYKYLPDVKGMTDGFLNTIKKHFLDLLTYYGVDINKHISFTDHYIDNDNKAVLKLNLNHAEISRRHIIERIGILKKSEIAPYYTFGVDGNKKQYNFILLNIDFDVDQSNTGLYLFTIRLEDCRGEHFSINKNPHVILNFSIVMENVKDAIDFAKQNGALHMLYMSVSSEYRMKEIVQDIKEGENYISQLEVFPYIGYFDQV